ncbi:MAG: SDR family NAD(P)-dependent oxidoreductase [Salinivirgaceae bacterium]
MLLKDKTVLITGGANGIGLGIVEAMSAAACQIIVADTDDSKGKQLAAEIEKLHFVKTDMSSEADVMDLFQFIAKQFGSLDILVNNVGVSVFKPLLEISVAEWDRILNTNLRSAFICSREFARLRKPQTYGRIINIVSTRHLMSEPGSEAYAASKGGLVSLTHALAASLQDKNFSVNCISPGWIHTGQPEELCETDKAQHFSKRVGNPADIARLCLYLCEPENDFISGQNFTIDGGMIKKMIYE